MSRTDRSVVSLSEKLRVADDVSEPARWMRREPVVAEPLANALDQSRIPDDPLGVPRVRAQIDIAISAAREQALQDTAEETSALHERLATTIAAIDETICAAFRLQATEVTELALIVAAALVGHELASDEAAIVGLVHRCVADIADARAVVVTLHPDDLARLQEHGSGEPSLTLRASADLAPGECVLETPEQLIDGRIAPRLDELRDGLVRLLQDGPC